MKKQFIKIFFMIAISLFFSKIAHADWLNEFSNSLTASSPTAYKTQAGTYFSGGGYSYKKDNTGNINLFSARAPSMKAGCGGINVDWGGLNFIRGETIIKFAKDVIGAAPGYAFNLAMQTLCPQCTDLMNTLSEAANMLNGMDLDSCAVAKAAVDAGGDLIGGVVQSSTIIDEKNSFNSMVKNITSDISSVTKHMENLLDKAGCKAGDKSKCPYEFLMGDATLLETAFARSTSLKKISGGTSSNAVDYNKNAMVKLVRAMIGDVTINKTTDSITVKYINPWFGAYNAPNQNEIINKWITGRDDIKAEQMISGASDITASTTVILSTLDSTGNRSYASFSCFSGISQKNLKEIKTAFRTRTALTDENLKFVSSFRSPVYKMLNQTSIDDQLFDNFIGSFETLAGVQLAYETVSIITRELSSAIAVLENEISTYKYVNSTDEYAYGLNDMKDNLRKLSEFSYKLYEKAYDIFNGKMKSLNQVELMTKKVEALMARHPIAGLSKVGISK